MRAAEAPPESAPPKEARPAACQNCGTPLYGEHCYACGQPTRGLVRHVSSIVGDAADTLFNVDGRLLRTLPMLLLNPGVLSQKFFDGHRVRYVSPVRLFVVLCVATFFAAKLSTPSLDVELGDGNGGDGTTSGIGVGTGDRPADFAALTTPEAVEQRRREDLADIAQARTETAAIPGLGSVLDSVAADVDAAADARLRELGPPGPDATADPPAASPDYMLQLGPDSTTLNFNGHPWHPQTNPLVVDGLPDTANAWLNAQIGHIPRNWERIREEPDLLSNAFYSALPTALFVLVPVFAGLLKLVFLLRRRLYMEHLVVALHGHAFVCAMLLVSMGLSALRGGLGEAHALAAPIGWMEWAAMLWIPWGLWRQLRLIYRQRWYWALMTASVLAMAEMLLLSIVATAALLVSLVWL